MYTGYRYTFDAVCLAVIDLGEVSYRMYWGIACPVFICEPEVGLLVPEMILGFAVDIDDPLEPGPYDLLRGAHQHGGLVVYDFLAVRQVDHHLEFLL